MSEMRRLISKFKKNRARKAKEYAYYYGDLNATTTESDRSQDESERSSENRESDRPDSGSKGRDTNGNGS